MATEESNIVQACRVAASKSGARVFRNNRGLFLTIDALALVKNAAMQFGVKGVLELLRSGRIRKVRAGLEVPGSSDLIGWHTVIITPEMVGRPVAVFCAPEVKQPGKHASPDQKTFIANVQKAGGIAGVVRSGEDMAELLAAYIK